MEIAVNAAALDVLPFFAPGADGSDQMMVTTAVILLVIVAALGVTFFWIHSLPERMAHRGQKVQMEVVAVLCLLALFTHIHAFWVVALFLAMIDLPTLANPVERIAGSLERIAVRDSARPAPEPEDTAAPQVAPRDPGPAGPPPARPAAVADGV